MRSHARMQAQQEAHQEQKLTNNLSCLLLASWLTCAPRSARCCLPAAAPRRRGHMQGPLCPPPSSQQILQTSRQMWRGWRQQAGCSALLYLACLLCPLCQLWPLHSVAQSSAVPTRQTSHLVCDHAIST